MNLCILCGRPHTPRRAARQFHMGLYRYFCADCVDAMPSSSDITHRFNLIVRRSAKDKNTLTKEQLIRRLYHSRGLCAYCGQEVGIKNLVVDHIHPVCKGGAATVENLAGTCQQCNSKKSGSIWPAPVQPRILDQAELIERTHDLLAAKGWTLGENAAARWYRPSESLLNSTGGVSVWGSDLEEAATILQADGLRIWDDDSGAIDVYSR